MNEETYVYVTHEHPNPNVGSWVGCNTCAAEVSFHTKKTVRSQALHELMAPGTRVLNCDNCCKAL